MIIKIAIETSGFLGSVINERLVSLTRMHDVRCEKSNMCLRWSGVNRICV
jgi:hypothetical protein